MLVCSIFVMSSSFPTFLVGGQNRFIVAGDFATSTIASLTFSSKEYLVPFFAILFNVLLSIAFVWKIRRHRYQQMKSFIFYLRFV